MSKKEEEDGDEYFTDVETYKFCSKLSNSIGALADAAASISGDSKNRINMESESSEYEYDFFYPVNHTEAIRRTREVFYKLQKRVDVLSDVTLVLALENIFAAINQIVSASKNESTDSFAMARKKMEYAEQKAIEAFHQSLKDEKALVLEDLEKTTISIQLVIFLKIIIPSFKLSPETQCIKVFHSLFKVDKKHIARNLKDLVDDLFNIQSRIKSKQLLPSNGSGRANAGKFQEMVDFVLKIVYPYFLWGAPNMEPKKDMFGYLANDADFSPILEGNNPKEPLYEHAVLKILPKYLGRGRAASCEVNIGRFSHVQSDTGYPQLLEKLRTIRWGEKTVTIKLWRGESAIFGTSVADRNGEEELVLYHELNNDDKEIEIKLMDLLNHKWGVNVKRIKEDMVILGLEDYVTSEPSGGEENKKEEVVEEQSEDNTTAPLPKDEKVKTITLVPKDFPTWSEDSLPIFTNVILNVDPKPVTIKPLFPIAQYIARKFCNPKAKDLDLPQDEEGESIEEINRKLYQSFLDDDRDSSIYYEEYDEDILWPWKPVVLNIWRGERALLGTVSGVLVFIQPFEHLSEKFTLDVNTLKRCSDWNDLTKEEIAPGVNVNVRYLGVGYKTRCPIILGDFPKHEEDLFTREIKKDEDEEKELTKDEQENSFWKGFLYSECPELVVEIWKEDDFMFGIIQGTDNVVICQNYASPKSTKEHLNLTLKESLENKPKSLGEFLQVSSSPGDRGNHLDVCGIYAKQQEGYVQLSNNYFIQHVEEEGWEIRNETDHKMQNRSQYQIPPVTGWRINTLEEKGRMVPWNPSWKPAPQINVMFLGKKETQVPEEVLLRTCISVPVYGLSRNKESRRSVSLKIDEDDVSSLQKALGYNFWGGWIAGGHRKLQMKMWVENGFVIGTYQETDDVIFHQCLEHEDEEIVVSFDKLRHRPKKLGEFIFVNSTGAASLNMLDGWFDNALGVYERQKFTIQDHLVFQRQRPILNPTCAYLYIAIVDGAWAFFELDAQQWSYDLMKQYGEGIVFNWEDSLKKTIENETPLLKYFTKPDEVVPSMPPGEGWSFRYLNRKGDFSHRDWMNKDEPEWKEDPHLRLLNYSLEHKLSVPSELSDGEENKKQEVVEEQSEDNTTAPLAFA